MNPEGHAGINLMLYSLLIPIMYVTGFGYHSMVVGVVIVAVSSLPDQDQRISRIRHRGPTHTIWFALLTGLVIGLFLAYAGSTTFSVLYNALAPVLPALGVFGDLIKTLGTAGRLSWGVLGFAGGFLGVLGHIVGDLLTPSGVAVFSPLKDRKYTMNFTNYDSSWNWRFSMIGTLFFLGAVTLSFMYL